MLNNTAIRPNLNTRFLFLWIFSVYRFWENESFLSPRNVMFGTKTTIITQVVCNALKGRWRHFFLSKSSRASFYGFKIYRTFVLNFQRGSNVVINIQHFWNEIIVRKAPFKLEKLDKASKWIEPFAPKDGNSFCLESNQQDFMDKSLFVELINTALLDTRKKILKISTAE